MTWSWRSRPLLRKKSWGGKSTSGLPNKVYGMLVTEVPPRKECGKLGYSRLNEFFLFQGTTKRMDVEKGKERAVTLRTLRTEKDGP